MGSREVHTKFGPDRLSLFFINTQFKYAQVYIQIFEYSTQIT